MDNIINELNELNINSNDNNSNIEDNINNENSINDKKIDELYNDSYFKKYSGVYGINNTLCKVFDDEDFLYMNIHLPNIIIDEIVHNGNYTFNEYFNHYMVNNDNIFISFEHAIYIADIYDVLTSYDDIGYGHILYINNIVNEIEIKVNDNELDFINDDYIHDILCGILILNRSIQELVKLNLLNDNSYNLQLYKQIINISVCIIYLIFYFETNILSNYANNIGKNSDNNYKNTSYTDEEDNYKLVFI